MPMILPEGRWPADVSNESGWFEVYTQRFRGGGKVQISREGDSEPPWAQNGRELFSGQAAR
jgi:hypothetical protein